MASIARLPKPLIDSYEWQYEGACHEADPETFFSPESERGPRRRARRRLRSPTAYAARSSTNASSTPSRFVSRMAFGAV
jgi:ribonuclease I